ncbi:hypothetical protein Caci_6554 [Catenulispora acidiphila DSM 44928]|uniref:Uncharacterized protein n=1 Tax=Catenulispora acidiphila (strain DSM 44928 / JCM 14897 / NBRC 102108 / NRRL B-24433 / ID139908) TaxID=479433 RepID=C7PYB1_CATAD|nr:hypothetical protein [Catenulispora acidiphila]ACU75401.1 hypothetical protein Caci_6554 [Catenulispora acidiphila DSM 44928]
MSENEFEEEIKGLLSGLAEAEVGDSAPVGRMRRDFRAAAARRRRVVTTTTALAVTSGVTLGVAFGAGGNSGSTGNAGAIGPADSAGVAAPRAVTTTAPTPKPTPTPTPKPAAEPSPQIPAGPLVDANCVTANGKTFIGDVNRVPMSPRGSLAGDNAFVGTVLARAEALVPANAAKVEMADDDGHSRVAVVYLNPKAAKSNGPCDKGMEAVVFHGPSGASVEDLLVQAGGVFYGPDYGFNWAERNDDGSESIAVVYPEADKTVSFDGSLLSTDSTAKVSHETNNGELLVTLPAGAALPVFIDVPSLGMVPGGTAGSPLMFVAAKGDAAAYAAAIGGDITKVGPLPKGMTGTGFSYPKTEGNEWSSHKDPRTLTGPGTDPGLWMSFIG